MMPQVARQAKASCAEHSHRPGARPAGCAGPARRARYQPGREAVVTRTPLNPSRVQRPPDPRRLRTVARDYVKEHVMLPAEFAALERYSDWALETEAQRYAKCLASTSAEMQAFYDAVFPLLDPAMAHLAKYPLSDMPRPERKLMLLVMSVITVPPPAEVPEPPRVPRSGAAYLKLLARPGPDIPRLPHANTGRHA